MLKRIQRIFENEKFVLIFVMAILSCVIIARGIYTWFTGFMTSDEALYYLSGLESVRLSRVAILYENRYIFQAIISILFLIFQIKNVFGMIVFATTFSLVWTLPLPYIIKKITELFTTDRKTVIFSVLFLPFFPILTIMSATFVTEPMTLTLMMTAIYFFFKMFKHSSLHYPLLSGLLFAVAVSMREPYMVFLVVNILFVLVVTIRRKFSWKSALIFSSLAVLGMRIPLMENFLSSTYLKFGFTNAIITMILKPIGEMFSVTTSFIEIPPIIMPIMDMESPIFLFTINKVSMGFVWFLLSIFVGWNPFFAIFGVIGTVLSVLRIKKERSLINVAFFLNILCGFLNFFGVAYIVQIGNVSQVQAGANALGSCIRNSHTSLPSIISIRECISKIKVKYLYAILFCIVIAGGASIRYAFTMFQQGWSQQYVERLTLDYKAPHYRLYEYVETTGKTLVFGGHNLVLPSLYLRLRPNVKLLPPLSESEFRKVISEKWDNILIFGVRHYPMRPALELHFPWFLSLIDGKTEFKLEVIWEDGESFLYRVLV